MGINSYNNLGQNPRLQTISSLDSLRKSIRMKNTGVSVPVKDTFTKNVSGVEMQELDRLFPNGDIHRIFNDIVKEYGIENPPELIIMNKKESNDRGLFDVIQNRVILNLIDIDPNARKYLLETDELKWYSLDKHNQCLKVDSNPNDIERNLSDIQKAGLTGKAVPLTDDDKRKMIIFTLAHELEHCVQDQTINKTEGLFSLNAVKERCYQQRKNKNLIDWYMFTKELEQTYMEKHKYLPEKIYPINSPEGKKALEWYNSKITYIDPIKDSDTYLNNPLEVDANNRAAAYIKKHYGGFNIDAQ